MSDKLSDEQKKASKTRLDLTAFSHEEIMHIFNFDFENGKVFWKNPDPKSKRLIGKEAGYISTKPPRKPYRTIRVGDKNVATCKLMFFAFHGRPPEKLIDHIDGNSLNDRPSNLREADYSQNTWNTRVDAKRGSDLPRGVHRTNPKYKTLRYWAKIQVRRKLIYLGTYDTPEEASIVYQKARREYYGEFAPTEQNNKRLVAGLKGFV